MAGRERRGGAWPWRAALFALTVVVASGCAGTVRIEKLLSSHGEYDGRTVQVEGTVTRSAGLLGVGAFELDDGSGTIVVIAQGQGVPARGSRTKVKGTFESLFSLAGSTIAAIVQPRRE